MAAIFCPSCGARAEYQFSAPNFCSKCGKAYLESKMNNLTAKMRIAKTKNNSLTKNVEEIDDEYDFDDSDDANDDGFSSATRVPHINKLQVEIDSSTDVRVIKFEDLINQNSNSNFIKGKNLNLDDLTNR
jgi:hypothetical protein